MINFIWLKMINFIWLKILFDLLIKYIRFFLFKEKFRRHFERTILIVFARAILHEFIFVYIFYDQNGDVITSKIAENLPPDMRKTIWFTYYIDLMKVLLS